MFLPESKIKLNEMLSKEEIFDYFGLEDDDDENFSILNALINFKGKKSKMVNNYCQTEKDIESHKISRIEENFIQKTDYFSLKDSKKFEENYIRYKKEIEVRCKEEYDDKIRKFIETKALEIRMDENIKFKEKLAKEMKKYQEEYKNKLDDLKKRESNALNLCQLKLKVKIFLLFKKK